MYAQQFKKSSNVLIGSACRLSITDRQPTYVGYVKSIVCMSLLTLFAFDIRLPQLHEIKCLVQFDLNFTTQTRSTDVMVHSVTLGLSARI